MSSVTDIILSTTIEDGATEEETHPNADVLSNWLVTNYKGGLVKVDQLAGGNKAMQRDVFLAAINYLDHEAFLALFHSVNWEWPEDVQLLLKGEHDDVFTVHTPSSSSSGS
jgi:hypothetical protein